MKAYEVSKASNIHDNKIVVRHRLYTPTLNSATFQHFIANDTATLQHVLQCYRNLSARSGNIRGPLPELSYFFASHSATSNRCWRLYLNLSYDTARMHANTCRTGPMAKFCPFMINDTR